ncbi:hypothetical protein CAMGR0001_0002 [Campylobacter gracilis RM3268]|uniref:Uncharacterized protein n=1 Tax=Campylobacter gracilis RM3268 TaxID=553220 RepID=C8PEB8_9BACT|nr:hypothetical protein CAMGR0001_0002 [Campylobacter gracilis RM3268]
MPASIFVVKFCSCFEISSLLETLLLLARFGIHSQGSAFTHLIALLP